MIESFDLLIRRGTVIDGTGAEPRLADVAVRDGKIVAISAAPLPSQNATKIIDAQGQWVTPGFIDIHTHYDAELLVAPGLKESVRHGVTTCVIGSCSLSMIYSEAEDASDIFTRVEGVPREYVLPLLQKTKNWNDAKSYIDHLNTLPLGPNIAGYIGHSDLRAAVMGLGRSVDPKEVPSEAEMQLMEKHLNDGIDQGLLGLSAMTNPWDKLDGDRFRSKALPSVYARWSEYRRLHKVLRKRGAVLQSAPNLNNQINAVFFFFTSASLALRSSLKTTLVALADLKAKPGLDILSGFAARLFNRFFGANFRWQALPQPFKVFADGIDFVIFEEFPTGEMALHLKRDYDRNKLLANPAYRERFKAQCLSKWGGRVWNRDFGDVHIITCPDPSLVGKTIGQVAKERGVHEVYAFLDLVIEYSREMRWSTVVANNNPRRLAINLNQSDSTLVGFSDAGAHLRNLAFYNFGLWMLQLAAQEQPAMTPQKAVWRLTGELADWYDLNSGKLEVGAQADIVVLDPKALKSATLGSYAEVAFEELGGMQRVVNRNDGVVKATIINGNVAFADDVPHPDLGRVRFGRFLRRQASIAAIS